MSSNIDPHKFVELEYLVKIPEGEKIYNSGEWPKIMYLLGDSSIGSKNFDPTKYRIKKTWVYPSPLTDDKGNIIHSNSVPDTLGRLKEASEESGIPLRLGKPQELIELWRLCINSNGRCENYNIIKGSLTESLEGGLYKGFPGYIDGSRLSLLTNTVVRKENGEYTVYELLGIDDEELIFGPEIHRYGGKDPDFNQTVPLVDQIPPDTFFLLDHERIVTKPEVPYPMTAIEFVASTPGWVGSTVLYSANPKAIDSFEKLPPQILVFTDRNPV